MSGISRQAACEQVIVAVLDTVTNLNGSSSDKWTGSTDFGLCGFTKKTKKAHQVTSWKECWSRQRSEIHTYKNTHLLSGYRLSHFHNWIFYKLLYHSSAQEHEHVKFVKAMVPSLALTIKNWPMDVPPVRWSNQVDLWSRHVTSWRNTDLLQASAVWTSNMGHHRRI